MKAVVISGGQLVSRRRVDYHIKDADLIVCADKGADYASMYGIVPDIVVGDMDSVDSSSLSRFKKSKIIISPAEKDYTDTHLAVIKALEEGADSIIILCATGLRSDHAMANIRLLLFIDDNGAIGKIIDDENTIMLCTSETVFLNKKGTTISILSLSDKTKGITLEGFKYSLVNQNADLKWTTGISNEIIKNQARIYLTEGCLLVFEIHKPS